MEYEGALCARSAAQPRRSTGVRRPPSSRRREAVGGQLVAGRGRRRGGWRGRRPGWRRGWRRESAGCFQDALGRVAVVADTSGRHAGVVHTSGRKKRIISSFMTTTIDAIFFCRNAT